MNRIIINGVMVCMTKLLNQLGVTAANGSLHNLIDTLKSDRPESIYRVSKPRMFYIQ